MTATQTAGRSTVYPSDDTRRRRQHRGWPYLLALFLVLAVIAGGVVVVYRTSFFAVQKIAVTARSGELDAGVHDAVLAAVVVPTGTPLVSVNLVAVRRAALRVPQIATAAVSRHWPDELTILVTQRRPAAVTSANGALW